MHRLVYTCRYDWIVYELEKNELGAAAWCSSTQEFNVEVVVKYPSRWSNVRNGWCTMLPSNNFCQLYNFMKNDWSVLVCTTSFPPFSLFPYFGRIISTSKYYYFYNSVKWNSVIFLLPPSVQNNAGPFPFHISMAFINTLFESPINNTFALHPPIPTPCTPSIISINTFITIISQAVQEISFCEIWRLCAACTRVNLYKPGGRGVLQYTPLQAGLTSPRNIPMKPALSYDVIVNVLHYHTLHESQKPIFISSREKKITRTAFENLYR